MAKIIAYLRASTDKQDINHQKLELLCQYQFKSAPPTNLKVHHF